MVTVEGVREDTIDLSFSLFYQTDWSWEAVQPYVIDAITAYFKELAESWADQEDALVVRLSQLESRILGVSGVLDIAGTAINGEAANYALPQDHIPILGEIAVEGVMGWSGS